MWVPLVRQLRGEEQQMVHLWDINSLKSYSLNTLEAFLCVLFKFLAFVRFSAQGYDSAPPSARKQVGFTTDTD